MHTVKLNSCYIFQRESVLGDWSNAATCCIQIKKSSANFSLLSMKETVSYASPDRTVAVYKGLTVDVCKVDKNEISLARQDLVELINVSYLCICLSVCLSVSLYLTHVVASSKWVTRCWRVIMSFSINLCFLFFKLLLSHFHARLSSLPVTISGSCFAVERTEPQQYSVVRRSVRWTRNYLLSGAVL